MAAQPYNVILAGKYGVGKSALFDYLSRQQGQRSVRSWDKWEHVMSIGKEQVQVILWDTANMEKNDILSMSRSYFAQCVGVILVYKKGDMESLLELKQWANRAQESEWCGSVVFSLWCHNMGSYSDEVTPEHRQQIAASWGIPPELVFDVNAAADGRNVKQSYQQVVATVHQKWVSNGTRVRTSPCTPAGSGGIVAMAAADYSGNIRCADNQRAINRKCLCVM